MRFIENTNTRYTNSIGCVSHLSSLFFSLHLYLHARDAPIVVVPLLVRLVVTQLLLCVPQRFKQPQAFPLFALGLTPRSTDFVLGVPIRVAVIPTALAPLASIRLLPLGSPLAPAGRVAGLSYWFRCMTYVVASFKYFINYLLNIYFTL